MAKVIRKKGDIDFKQLNVLVNGLDSKKLQTGWFESARYDGVTPVAGVAAVQEFGTASGGIPPRPFLRPTIEDNQGDWRNVIEQGLKEYLKGSITIEDLYEILGSKIVGQIQKSISNVSEPPLSPITLALRKQKLANKRISGKVVGATAAAIAEGKTGKGELGDSSGINPKPLVFDGVMFNAVTHEVTDK